MLRLYPDFGNLPVTVQVALWDLIYNLGQGGFADYRLLRQAIRDGNWEEAARQSHRDLPDEERNQYVFDLFMEALDTP